VNSKRDRGAADALGLVLIAPVVVGFAVLVVWLGRSVDTQAQTRNAAEVAAQAAALERTPAAAVAAAQRTASAVLAGSGFCADPQVDVDTSQFRPGGLVTVNIACRVSDSGLSALPAVDRQTAARAVARVDQFRATEAATP
jgi:hypothetical protein